MNKLFGCFSVFLLFLAVAIAVSITVTIAITISVAVALGVGTVEHYGHVVELLLGVELLYVGELTAVDLARLDHEDGEVGNAVGDGGIGDDAHGHVVHDDVFVAFAQLGDEFVEAAVHE